MKSPRVALLGLVVGAALAAGPTVLWLLDESAAPPLPSNAAAPQVAPVPLPGPVPGAAAPALAAPAPAAPAAAPVRIRAAGVDLDAPVGEVGVDARGLMEVPRDVKTVGWYRFGPSPGDPAGAAVLAGHVDDRVQGLGAFHRIADLPVGSPVEVVLADGSTLAYRVAGVERVGKTELPVDRVFARDGPPRLVLVTCGGNFDRGAGVYTDNVIVTADPATGS